ncbi:unnamed protein product [Cuscuta campestris]|uniref:Carrier domain-containing protein n=1 Tax=Cuscuta campestris TaxID=132261 RepID=A0A484N009_9ASTE|nr:unnamed protein product [Cuscuta campestris]
MYYYQEGDQVHGHSDVSCAAKPETVDKVCSIVKKQLALADSVSVSGESKFIDLGADSLDTVEIVMGLEAFGVTLRKIQIMVVSKVLRK